MNTYSEVIMYDDNKKMAKYLLSLVLLFTIFIILNSRIEIYDSKNVFIKDNEIYLTCTNNCMHLLAKNNILINGKKYKFRAIWFGENIYKIILNKKIKNIKTVKTYKGSVSTLQSFLNILRTKGET